MRVPDPMSIQEMGEFFAWIDDIKGPEVLLELGEANVAQITALVVEFRGGKAEAHNIMMHG